MTSPTPGKDRPITRDQADLGLWVLLVFDVVMICGGWPTMILAALVNLLAIGVYAVTYGDPTDSAPIQLKLVAGVCVGYGVFGLLAGLLSAW